MIAVSYSNPTGQASLGNGMDITRSSVFGQHVLLHLFLFWNYTLQYVLSDAHNKIKFWRD